MENRRTYSFHRPRIPDLAVIVTNQKINDTIQQSAAKLNISKSDEEMYERSLAAGKNTIVTTASNESDIDFNLLRKEILTLYSILTSISFVNVLGLALS